MKRKWLVYGIVFLLSLALAGQAFADATVTISGGTLAVTPQSIGFGTVTLDGTDQTVNDGDVTAWAAVDPTGTGAGWHVTIAATDFTDGGTNSIAVANFKARLLDATVSTVTGNTAPASSITTYTALSTVAQTLLAATAGNGMGSYEYIPDFTLDVVAETYAAAYTSTVTVAIVSGP